MRRSFTALVAGLAALLSASPASATLWNWSFGGGAEQGTFQTNGTFGDTAGAFNFVIDINSFAVTASSFAVTLVGDSFSETQPVQGFLWSGTTAVQFYRSSGAFTNGSNFFAVEDPYRIIIGISGTPVASIINTSTGQSTGFSTLTLAPVSDPQTAEVPEPASLALLTVGLAGLVLRRRA